MGEAESCQAGAQVRAAISRQPRLRLGRFPTPVSPWPVGDGIWLKDEGCCADAYGGNKVRKWEFLAPALRGQRVVLWGDVESHNLMAGVQLGRLVGCPVEAVVYHFLPTAAAAPSLDALARAGARVHPARVFVSAWARARWLAWRRRAWLMPLGSTTPVSTLGWVSAAHELEDQVAKADLPAPDLIYVALGSGGTVAGLLIGLAASGLPSRLVAVRTVQEAVCSAAGLGRQIRRTVAFLGQPASLADAALARLERIDRTQLGLGYRDLTPAGLAAVARAQAHGLELEPVFTGKVLACLLADAQCDPVPRRLFWNTHSRVDPCRREHTP